MRAGPSAKSGIGTALMMSQIWFTMSHGILNEIYYRRPDQACTRDLGLIVTDGDGFFSEEKRHAEHRTSCMAHGVPAYQTVNVHPNAIASPSVSSRTRTAMCCCSRSCLSRWTANTGVIGCLY